MDDKLMEDFIDKLDRLIMELEGQAEAHSISAMLLSRVTLLQTMDPATGKQLLQFVWEKLDEIEQADPSNLL